MEVALDFAVQCSPDHPWLKQHPEWFKRRPDGSIRYAENPPKKYEDIVNPDFYCADRIALWQALRDVVLFWVEQGVRIFRVDNPHTKPFPFWEWLIREVQARDPDVLFLAEAFTRPKIMKALAKLGFTQSYTYFTWRTAQGRDAGLSQRDHRAIPSANISGRISSSTRPTSCRCICRAASRGCSSRASRSRRRCRRNYGIYNGFELLEHEPIPGREEYLNSEKYEIKVRDWNKPGNIKDYIGRAQSRCGASNPALLQTTQSAFRAGRRRRRDRLRQGIGRRRQCRRRAPSRSTATAARHSGCTSATSTSARRRRQPRARDRKSGHRRAAHARMGRRAAAHRSGATIPRCCSAAWPEQSP